MENKNVNAINKIIAELAMKDFLVMNPIDKDGRRRYAHHRAYSLSEETKEAIEIKNDYLIGNITESEYKRWLYEYNMRTFRMAR